MTQKERMSLPIWKKIILSIITIIIFGLQIQLFVFAFQINFSRELSTAIYLLIEGLAAALVLYIILQPMITSYKLTWSILILALPLPFSLLFYLNVQSRTLPQRKQKKIASEILKRKTDNSLIKEVEKIKPTLAKHAKILQQSNSFPVYKNTKYTYIDDGYKKHIDFIAEIKKAQRYIFIETFILSDGVLLEELLPILVEKGNSGVEIKIIYDDLGSKRYLKGKTIKYLAEIPNCEIVNYNPLGLNINPAFNYRDHRKIIIIDGIVAYCGGDNLADEYIHQKERFGFWRDNCGKFEGDAVKTFVELFIETWYISTKKILERSLYTNSNYQLLKEDSYVIPFGDGPTDSTNIGYDVFMSMITNSSESLYISTPYLVIDDAMIDSIVLAAKSGIDVRILMPGIPDKKSAFYLARFHYKKILKAGGKIYEFSKGFNHAKNIIVDNDCAFIGTINMDYRSMFLHYECGAVIMLDDEILKMKKDFLKACNESKQITYDDWKKRPWWQKLFAYVFYLFAPMF